MGAGSSTRFLARFALPREPVTQEVLLGGRHATVYLPREPAGGRSVPAWILLHGITVPGRHHAALVRMAGALSAAGHLALVPEVPAWSALRVTPADTAPAVHDALEALPRWPRVDRNRVGLMGFSVAGTWALEVAAGDLRDRFATVASMGGYRDLHSALMWLIAGTHDSPPPSPPDPYGSWVMGASLLPEVEGAAWGTEADRRAAADALRRLAVTAGRHGAGAASPVYDPLIADLRRDLSPGARQTWDLLAVPGGGPAPDRIPARLLASALATAGERVEPMLDPGGRLAGLAAPAFVLHGYGDRLIPASESRLLWEEVPEAARRRLLVTRLMGHTKRSEAGRLGPLSAASEASRFAAFVADLLDTVERRD